ncbi:MAG: hypothetical protein AB7U35_04785 [Sphingobium sp.]
MRFPVVLAALALAGCSGSEKGSEEAVKQSASGYLVYATNERSGDISVIDPQTAREVKRIAIGRRPRGLVASPDGRFLYVAVSGSPIAGPGVDEDSLPPPDKSADGIAVVDLMTGTLIRTLRGVSDPEQIAISPDGEKLYIASEDTGQLVILSRQGSEIARLDVGGEPEGVAVSPDGTTALATSEEDNSIAVVKEDGVARVVAHIPVGKRPRNAEFLDARTVLVPGETDGSLTLVDLEGGKPVWTLRLDEGDRPMDLAKGGDGAIYITTGRGGRLLRVGLPAGGGPGAVSGSVAVGQRPWGLALSPDGTRAFTANGPGNDVAIVDTATMAVVGKVKAGDSPWGVAVVPARR